MIAVFWLEFIPRNWRWCFHSSTYSIGNLFSELNLKVVCIIICEFYTHITCLMKCLIHRFITEMAPSFSSSSELSKNVKFVNKVCRCGLKCSVKISESRDNPNRLYFCCPLKNKCGYFEWWEVPNDLRESGVMGADCCGLSHYENNADEKWKDAMNELRVLNMKMNGLVIFCVCLLIIVLLKWSWKTYVRKSMLWFGFVMNVKDLCNEVILNGFDVMVLFWSLKSCVMKLVWYECNICSNA